MKDGKPSKEELNSVKRHEASSHGNRAFNPVE